MSFNRNDLLQGLENQRANETPVNFGMLDGAAQDRPTQDLDVGSKKQRMAGGFQGQRALELLNNPNARAQADAFVAALNNPRFMRGQNRRNAICL